MKPMPVESARMGCGGVRCAVQFGENEDSALVRKIRAAAMMIQPKGRARLRLSRKALEEIRRLTAQAQRLYAVCSDSGEPLKRLVQEARLMEACAEKAWLDGARGLPAADGTARICIMARALCGRGDLRMNCERLMQATASFDDLQPLEMAELWAIPEAVRIALMEAYCHAARSALFIAEERRLAERWMDGENVRMERRAPAFFEHALRMLSDQESPERYAQLEGILLERGSSAEEIVQRAHEAQALALMRLENLQADRRFLDALDWQPCFEQLSDVESELCYDPAGVYADMDDDSRAAVRSETASLARIMKTSEIAVARHAVAAAQTARQEEDCEARQTVCYWLYDDEGRSALARRMGISVRLPKKTPDPTGRFTAAGMVLTFCSLFALYVWAVKSLWLAPLGIPLAWRVAMALIGRVFPHCISPAKLLKLEINRVPEELRTLVVMPALLSSVDFADQVCERMEALGCLEADANVRYLILGDFADASAEQMPEDDAIVARMRAQVRAMNCRAGEEKYYYLHRGRRLLEADMRWMGRDRKRGALMDLNRLLRGEAGAETAFSAEGAACAQLNERFRFVLTVDVDTRFLPEALHRLIGTLAHPLNAPRTENGRRQGYAVLQPQMEMTARACVNGFVRLFAGEGGANVYPASVSNLWQDATGTGLFGGKGLYDVRAFSEALEGALPEGRILSHDLIEGTLAGTALVSDACFYDGFPTTLSGFLRRFHRWTRGDWQLVPILFSSKRYAPEGRRLSAAARLRLLDNLLRSLFAPALIALLTQSVWLGRAEPFVIALLAAYCAPLLHPRNGLWRSATAELAILPATAACALDAVLRTLWRLAFSGKHLMDWVTSADAEAVPGGMALPGRVAAILMLPGLFQPTTLTAAIALAGLFVAAPEWMRDLEQTQTEAQFMLSAAQREQLTALAGDIWRFFEKYVTEESCFLPPDNVQIDPGVGAAKRTSPTNIGLYLMSAVSAWKLNCIAREAATARIEATVSTLETLEKWHGHLYNWYDTQTLRPLLPRYVSSVDSGNLAAALLLCAEALDEEMILATRMRALAQNMDFSALYDARRQLFVIGYDAETERMSEAHYDLLASESRILSMTAMMLGQVSVRHWAKLSRACAALEDGNALLSWSGTLFEYLMPELFVHAPKHTLLGQTVAAAVEAQRAQGEAMGRPWGISESGYCAFDLQLNYQYRAFGLRALSLSGSANENVVAPYAAVMAAMIAPREAVKNLEHMERLGWRGEYGFYEAADYQQGDEARLVCSYMAHHQGMALCALCNVLSDRALNRIFAKIPQVRALELQMDEKSAPSLKLRKRRTNVVREEGAARTICDARMARPQRRVVDAHLLGGAGATVLATADGCLHYQRNGVLATRFGGDLLNRSDGACVQVRREPDGETIVMGDEATEYRPGAVCIRKKLGMLRCELLASVSPEDGALLKRLRIFNDSEAAQTVRAMDCVPTALCSEDEWLAHPTFQNLFVEARRLHPQAMMLRRRPRSVEEKRPVLLHAVRTPGEAVWETSMETLTGREGSTMRTDGVRWTATDGAGAPLNPCSAVQCTLAVAPGETVEVCFAMGLAEEEEALRWIERNRAESAPERATQLAQTQARSMMEFLHLDRNKQQILDRCAAFWYDRRLAPKDGVPRGEASGVDRGALWSIGVSGDLPILKLRLRCAEETASVREAVRAWEFYHTMGVNLDLVLVNDNGNDYVQPVRDAASEVIACSSLSDLRGARGGVHLLEGRLLNPMQREALERAATLRLEGGEDFYAQLSRALATLELPQAAPKKMALGENRLLPLKVQGNGWGCFLADGRYAIDVRPGDPTPAPWSNLLTNNRFGMLTTEHGGGFLWCGNSRSGRLTAFANDPLCEGWGWMLYLIDESGAQVRLLPGQQPQTAFRSVISPTETVYRMECESLSSETAICVRTDAAEVRIHTTLTTAKEGNYRLVGFVDWLMGTDVRDAAFLHTWNRDGACFAAGAADGIGYFAAANARVRAGGERTAFLGRGGVQSPEGAHAISGRGGWVLEIPIRLSARRPVRVDWTLGCAADAQAAYARVRGFYAKPEYETIRRQAMDEWNEKTSRLRVETPDEVLNAMMNGWLTHQTLSARIQGRTGLYQPGGAYGFRDQLQDMLSLLETDPQRVREHILRCAAHQFEDGDVMHWWHESALGVRTRISDDLLFLPYVTARYVRWTQDASILEEQVGYLENVEIEPGKEDRFCEMRLGNHKESLHEHCMRAFRRADCTGTHGLLKMGAGDWNDGMNRVGAHGRGESVWLTEFMVVCAAEYAHVSPSEVDRAWLLARAEQLSATLEAHGWDGKWYLRAYADDGSTLGGCEASTCRIDAISQAWAVLAGMDEARCKSAMDAAWDQLVDEEAGILRLLTPPFEENGMDPGYIRGYPAGVRENGAQYTHAACWLLLALIRMGDGVRSHRALQMLLPANHSKTRTAAEIYRVEPYVLSADVYDGAWKGRGGWTWYTGSAAWLYVGVLALLGFEREGSRVRLNALLEDWPEAAVTIRCGSAVYRLVCKQDVKEIALDGQKITGEWIDLIDDGKNHEAVFPPRVNSIPAAPAIRAPYKQKTS